MMMTLDPHHPIDFCPKADKLEVMKRATHRHEERRSEVDIAWTTPGYRKLVGGWKAAERSEIVCMLCVYVLIPRPTRYSTCSR